MILGHTRITLDVADRLLIALWTQDSNSGQLKLNNYIHLYRLVGHEDVTAQQISENADHIIRLKTSKRSVPQDLLAAYGRFVKSVTEKNGETHWVRDTSKIDEAVECSGYFALRSNAVSDAFEALSIYRQRNMLEQDFYQLKNWLVGDRLREGAVAVQGKLLVNTIGTALRMMMLCRAKQKEDRKSNLVLLGGSLDRLLAELTLVRAEKRKKALRA